MLLAYTRSAKVNFWHVSIAWNPCRNACSRNIAFVKFHNFLVNLYISGYLNKNFMSKIPDNITSIKALLKKIVTMVQVHKN